GAFFLPLVELDDPFGLVADVDHHVVAADLEHLAGDDLVGLVVLVFALDPGADFLVEDLVEIREFFFGCVELAEEGAVDHSLRGTQGRAGRVLGGRGGFKGSLRPRPATRPASWGAKLGNCSGRCDPPTVQTAFSGISVLSGIGYTGWNPAVIRATR